MSNKYQNYSLVIRNGLYLFFRLLLVLFLGFFATRLSLQVLGDEKFGIYNIIGGIIAIFAIISMPIRDSILRFYNVEFAHDILSPSVVFKTSMKLVFVMIVLITLLYETIGLVLINSVIQYPIEEKAAVNTVFQISVLTNIAGFVSLPLISLLFAKENMGVPAFCEICGSIVKIVLLYLMPYIPINVLILYSCVFLIINILSFFFYFFYCRHKYSVCFLKSNVDNTLKKNMLSFSGWSFLEAVSGIALVYVSNVFINIFGGILYNTAYGVSKQLQNAVVSFSSNVLKASDPQIISNTATNNHRYRDKLVMTTAKISLIGTAYIYIIFHFNGEMLLGLWLEKIPAFTVDFCDLSILATVFTSVTLPFRTTIMATGKIKGYFIFSGVVCFFSMLIMYMLLKEGFPIIYIMYIITISGFIMAALSVYYAHREAQMDIGYILKEILISLIAIFLVALICKLSIHLLVTDILSRLSSIIISIITLLIVSYFVVLNSNEKKKINQIVKKTLHKLTNSKNC